MSPIFNSEVKGAHYDHVNSLSGSVSFTSEWEPKPTTQYDHYFYSPEPINALQVLPGDSPYESEAFEKHKFDGSSWNPLDNHTRTNTSEERNLRVVSRMIVEISESGR